MKAAILDKLGSIPKYGDFQDPIPQNDQQLVMNVKAATIKQLDKIKASGQHYTTYPSFPTTVGVDGAGILENGKRVYASGITGMIAEKALIKKDSWVEIPDNLDFETASAIPNPLMGSDMALLYKGKIKSGDVILINGATGITGKMAVQVAKYRGASKIIVTGRNEDSLNQLKKLGADEIISLKNSNEEIENQLIQLFENNFPNIILDYIWGPSAELIFSVLKKAKPYPVRIVSIGSISCPTINLPSDVLRSKPIEILGSGIGSLQENETKDYMNTKISEMFQLAANGKLKIDIETVELKNVEDAWQNSNSGKRIVVRI